MNTNRIRTLFVVVAMPLIGVIMLLGVFSIPVAAAEQQAPNCKSFSGAPSASWRLRPEEQYDNCIEYTGHLTPTTRFSIELGWAFTGPITAEITSADGGVVMQTLDTHTNTIDIAIQINSHEWVLKPGDTIRFFVTEYAPGTELGLRVTVEAFDEVPTSVGLVSLGAVQQLQMTNSTALFIVVLLLIATVIVLLRYPVTDFVLT